jgi:hypothetical protein
MFTAQYAHGNGGTYRYYRCTEKRGVCSQSYLREDILVFQLNERFQSISLCEKYTDWMLSKIDEWEREETAVSQSNVQNLSTKIKASEERMEKLVSAYLDGDIPKASCLTRKDKTRRSLAALKAQISSPPLRRRKAARLCPVVDARPRGERHQRKSLSVLYLRANSNFFQVSKVGAAVAAVQPPPHLTLGLRPRF